MKCVRCDTKLEEFNNEEQSYFCGVCGEIYVKRKQ